jgi:hypothetical protein
MRCEMWEVGGEKKPKPPGILAQQNNSKRIIRACMETTLELWDNSLNQSL